MKRSTAADRAIQKNLEILAAHGIDFGKPFEETKQELLAAGAEVVQSRAEILEATLASVRKPGSFSYRRCIRCDETFGADYKSVGYCTDHCRITHLYDTTGIRYLPGRTEIERWGGEPPLIIPPSVLKVMIPYARRILEVVDALEKKAQTRLAEEAESWKQLELELWPQEVVVGVDPPEEYLLPIATLVEASPLPPLDKVKPFVLRGKP